MDTQSPLLGRPSRSSLVGHTLKIGHFQQNQNIFANTFVTGVSSRILAAGIIESPRWPPAVTMEPHNQHVQHESFPCHAKR
jgi:hypothetical protein